jgi:hypothetical protein
MPSATFWDESGARAFSNLTKKSPSTCLAASTPSARLPVPEKSGYGDRRGRGPSSWLKGRFVEIGLSIQSIGLARVARSGAHSDAGAAVVGLGEASAGMETAQVLRAW